MFCIKSISAIQIKTSSESECITVTCEMKKDCMNGFIISEPDENNADQGMIWGAGIWGPVDQKVEDI